MQPHRLTIRWFLLAVPVMAGALNFLAIAGRADDGLTIAGGEHDILRIQAVINGHPSALALDTGFASGFLLFRQTIAQLGLAPPTGPAAPALGPGVVPWSFTPDASTWNLLGRTLKGIHGEVVTMPSDITQFGDYVGLVGWPAVRENIWVFDLADGKVGVAARVPAEASHWTRWRIGKDLDVLSLLDDSQPRKSRRLLIDTGNGSDGILLPRDQWLAWRAANPGQPITLTASEMLGEGPHATELGRAKTFALGDVVVRDVLVQEQDEAYRNEAPGESAIGLGLAALKRLDLVLDGPRGLAFIRPHPGPLPSVEYNRLGAEFLPVDEKETAFAARVLANSPAAVAGIRDGDLLLTVDGKKFKLSQDFVSDTTGLWDDPAGTPHVLGLQRGAVRLSITVTLRDLLGPQVQSTVNAVGGGLAYEKGTVVFRHNEDEFHVAEGDAKLGQNDFAQAIAEYDQAIALGYTEPGVFMNRGSAKYRTHDYAGAIKDCDRSIAEGYRLPENYLNRASAKEASGNHVGALADYGRAIKLNPQFADAYESRGNARDNHGDHRRALTDYDEAIRLNPANAGYYYNRGGTRMAGKNLAGAIADFDQAIALDPKNAEAYANRGVAQVMKGNFPAAIADYDRALALDPNNFEDLSARGKFKFLAGDFAGAIADLDRVIGRGGAKADLYFVRGSSKGRQGDTAGARADYDQAIRLDPKYAQAYRIRASARDDQSDYAGAIADYSQAIALDPKNAEAYANRGVVQYELKDYAAAIADENQAIALSPGDASYYTNRGNAKDDKGDHFAAIADYGQALRLNPNFTGAYIGRGLVKNAQGDYARAIGDFDRAIALDPKNAYAYGDRGSARFDQGDYAGAAADFGEKVALNPDGANGYAQRGDARVAAGDLAGAAGDYRRALQIDPTKIYARFCLSLTLRRLNQGDDAGLGLAVAKETNAWTKNVGLYLLANISEEKLLALAAAGKAGQTAGNRCEANFYIGMVHLLLHEAGPAREFFTRCVATKASDYTEFVLARAELARLGRP